MCSQAELGNKRQDRCLTWTIDGDQILVTTPEAAARRLITVNYDLRDLAPRITADKIKTALVQTVEPARWDSAGGVGKTF